MRLPIFAACLCVALPAFAADTSAPATAPVIQVLSDDAVKGADGTHVVSAFIDWPAGADTGKHTHPGDEYSYVIIGTIEIDVEGQPPQIYKGGDSYHNARGVVHEAKNLGTRAAKTYAVLVLDKDVPLTQPVK